MSARNSKLFTPLLLASIVGMLSICTAQQQPNSVAAYQCTSDYEVVRNPPAISLDSRLLRVCISGVSDVVECQQIVEATIKQASKDISDKLVVGGQRQDKFKDSM